MIISKASPPRPYATSDKNSFAYLSVSKRWPVVVTGAIDDVHRTISASSNEPKRSEGKAIVEKLAKLKYELQHNRSLSPLQDDGQPDIANYNQALESLGIPNWFEVPCLYAACYLYRRMQTYFALSSHWKSYDIFSRQKHLALQFSRPAVVELAEKYRALISQLEKSLQSEKSSEDSERAERILFVEICENSLWGNASDLGLLKSLTYEEISSLQGANARHFFEKNVLVNDLPAAYKTLKQAQRNGKSLRRIDIVLDNAGFELYVDLVLAGYLLAADLATQIVLHPKSIPWFVSDAVPADFAALLGVLANPQAFWTSKLDEQTDSEEYPLSDTESANLAFLFQHWSSLHQEGQLIIRPNSFWTTAHSYWELPDEEPTLYRDLQESELVIFKGDLNYRKLTSDAKWDTTTPFSTAIGPLGHESGIRTLALRTCKADTVVGLALGEDERLRAMDDDGGNSDRREWAWSGKWAVAQLCDGKL